MEGSAIQRAACCGLMAKGNGSVTQADGSMASQGFLAPLRTPLFLRIWLASLLSNLGFLFLSVGTAWQMTALTSDAGMVASVQTALMLPMTFLALPAGAIADMYDRRRIGLLSICLSMLSAAILATLTFLGHATPVVLLAFCVLAGTGMTLFSPAWQASVGEQVPRAVLGQAVALNAISFNIARSFGPALGGIVVALAGVAPTFASTSASYLPLLTVMFLWRRTPVPSRLPPERIDRAVGAGVRYVIHSPRLRVILVRTFFFCLGGSCMSALMPLVARDLLHGTANMFGLLLGAFGIGAVLGSIGLAHLRRALKPEGLMMLSAASLAAVIFVVAVSRAPLLTGCSLVLGGAAWMMALTQCNVLVQTSAPRWVAGRILAAYQTAIAAGVALGSLCWGRAAQAFTVEYALIGAAGYLGVTLLFGRILPMPVVTEISVEPVKLSDPEVNLDLTGRSGPIVITLDYRVAPDDARKFYRAMRAIRAMRQRNGAFDWTLARDIADRELWVERYQCPTWHDYLRQRDRSTPDELKILQDARRYCVGDGELQVRRLLERPFGSVRWSDDVPEDPVTITG
jgi:MFS family permease